MIKKEDVKVGVLLWLALSECPAIVTAVNDDSFNVQCLNYFGGTDRFTIDVIPGTSTLMSHRVIRICTLEEVRDYLNKRTQYFEDYITETEAGLRDARNRVTYYKDKVKTFLAAHS